MPGWSHRSRISTFFLFPRVLFCLLFIFESNALALTDEAQKVFKRSQESVFQIQIIDVHSREKSVIGSGFRISGKGLFATNYHVISDVVETPEQYQIEYFRDGKKIGSLKLKAIDIAHDLAILEGEAPGSGKSLKLNPSRGGQGSHVYPMGNPLDVGMVIIEGTYNGLVGSAPYQHILLSASLNPGMSGGPAFDARGNVVGVNVALEGNDLSYLVPVEYLIDLKNKVETNTTSTDWAVVIQNQILQQYNHFVSLALSEKWEYEKFGALRIPKNILSEKIKCWGRSYPEDLEKNRPYFLSRKRCRSKFSLYLSSRLRAGTIGYGFTWLESKSLNALKFFKLYSEEYSEADFYSSAGKEDVTNFKCENSFVNFASQDWKGVYCVRRFKKYPRLHDVFLSFAYLGDSPRKYIVQVGVTGVSEPLVRRFLKKFLGGIQWAG